MNKVYLVEMFNGDGATFGNWETIAVCTDEIEAINCEQDANELYPNESIRIIDRELNKIFFN